MTAQADTSDEATPGTQAAELCPAWHAFPHNEMPKRTGSAPTGICGEQAVRRPARGGRNELREAKPIILWSLFLVLIVVGLASALRGAWAACIVILAVIEFCQEGSAEKLIVAQRKVATPGAKVRLSGQLISLRVAKIVPSDIIELKTGDMVPADVPPLETMSFNGVAQEHGKVSRLMSAHYWSIDQNRLPGTEPQTQAQNAIAFMTTQTRSSS